jgi:hypothetical protein
LAECHAVPIVGDERSSTHHHGAQDEQVARRTLITSTLAAPSTSLTCCPSHPTRSPPLLHLHLSACVCSIRGREPDHTVDPVNPQYKMPAAPKRAVTPPRFNRDTLNNTDIDGTRPHYPINAFKTRDNLNKMDPSEQRKRNIFSQPTAGAAPRTDRLFVADINFNGEGGGNSAPPYMKLTRRAGMANPNEPVYVVDTKSVARAAAMHPNAHLEPSIPRVSALAGALDSDYYRQSKPHHRPPVSMAADILAKAEQSTLIGPIDRSHPPVYKHELRLNGSLDAASIPGAQVGTRIQAPKVHVLKQRPEVLALAQRNADRLASHVSHSLAMRYGQLTTDGMQVSDAPLYPHLIPTKREQGRPATGDGRSSSSSRSSSHSHSTSANSSRPATGARSVSADDDHGSRAHSTSASAHRPPAKSGQYASAYHAEYSVHAAPPSFAPVVLTKRPALSGDEHWFPFGANPLRPRHAHLAREGADGSGPLSPVSDFHQSTMGSPVHAEIYPTGAGSSKHEQLANIVKELKAEAPAQFVPTEPLRPVGVQTDGARTATHLVLPKHAAPLNASMHLVAAQTVAPKRQNPALDAMRREAAATGGAGGGANASMRSTSQFQMRRFAETRSNEIDAVRSLRF